MSFVIEGTFHSHRIAERTGKNGPFKAGDVLIEIDNSYTSNSTGEPVFKFELVPFNVFGKTAEKVSNYSKGEKVKVTFSLESQEYQKKDKETGEPIGDPVHYPRIKGIFINRLNEGNPAPTNTDLSF